MGWVWVPNEPVELLELLELEVVPVPHVLGLVEQDWDRVVLLPGPKHPTR